MLGQLFFKDDEFEAEKAEDQSHSRAGDSADIGPLMGIKTHERIDAIDHERSGQVIDESGGEGDREEFTEL